MTEAPPSPGPNRPWKRWLLFAVAGIILLAGIGYGASRLVGIIGTPKASPTPSPAPAVSAEERSKVADPKVSSSQLTVTSLNADNAEIIDLVVKALRVSSDTTLEGRLSVGGNGTFGGSITAANFQGSGAGLTSVNAALLNGQSGAFYQNLANSTGVVGVNQLPSNVALRNSPNTFTAANTFTGSVDAGSLALGTPLGLASGGLGLSSVASQGVLYGTTGGTLGVATPAGTGLCLISGATDVTWGACTGGSTVTSLNGLTGALTIAGATVGGSTITLDDATAASKGIASFNSANLTVTAGAVNTIQDINTGATPTFAGVNTNAINPSAALTIGSLTQTLTMQGDSSSSFVAASGANSTTLNFQAPTAAVTYRFLTAAAGTYDICTTAGNCAGSGGVTSLNGLTGTLTIAGATTGGSTITLDDATAASKGIASFSATNFNVTAGAVDTIQDIATSASPTFAAINTNSINPSGALTVGSSGQSATLQGSNTTITETNGANVAALTFAAPTANVTYQLQTAAAGTYDVCTTAGNCVGVGGSVSTSGGSANVIPKYTGATALGPSLLSDDGAVVTVGGDLSVTGAVTLTTALSIANGGTGAITPSGARSNLGAAAAGSNGDITALTGLTTALSVVQGGTGAVSLTSNGVLIGNGTSPISAITGSNGDCLVVAAGAPAFQSCPGSGGVSSVNSLTGALTIANATTGGSTITINNAVADGATKGIAAFSATNFTAASGVINTAQDINTGATPTFAGITTTGTAAVQGASLTVGAANNTDGSLVLQNATNAFTLALNAPAQTVGSATVSFPDTAGVSDTVCLLTLSNCVGTGGGVTGSGSTDRLAKFTSGGVIGNSTISDNGSTVTTTGDLVVQGGDATFGTTSQLASLIMHDGNGQTTTLQAGNSTGDLTFVLPTVTGNASDCLKQSGTGNQLIWDACDGGGGGSTASLQTAYVNGNSISTTGNDIAFTLNSSQNLTVTTAAGATGSTTYALADGANATPPAQLVLVTNNDTNQAVANGITIAAAAGGLTNGLNVSDAEITNAINVGDNTIAGALAVIDFTNFDVDASGNVTAGSLTLGTPLTTANGGTGAATTQGAINNLSQLTTNGDLLYNNGTNSTRLARGNNGECLTANATTILWASCGLSGDSISVNAAAASDADFIDTTATGTTAGVAWNLNTATSPDSISLTVTAASATQAGVVTNAAQTFAGDKTFSGNIIAGTSTTLSDNNLASTGALTLASGGSSDLSLQGAGAVNIGLSGGSNINIGTNAGVHTIGIGTGAADNDVTIGSTTAGSTLTLNSAGSITLGASTLQRTAAGTTTIDLLNSGADTTLSINNSDGTRVANLNVEGSLTLGTPLAATSGGTGANTTQGAINNLSQLTTNGDLLYNNGTNSTRLPRGNNGECLTANATTILWGACSPGGTGDSISVNGSAATDANFLDTTATGTTTGITWALNVGSNPDDITATIGNASATVAGAVTTGTQTLAGDKTLTGSTLFKPLVDSTTALQVQNAVGSNIILADSTAINTLITNGNMEGASNANWALKAGSGSTARDTTTSFSGAASEKVTLTSTAIGDGVKYTPTSMSATTYTLSFSIKQTAGDAFGTNLGVGYNNGADQSCALSPSLTSQPVSTTGWVQYRCTFTATGSPTYLYWKQTDSPAVARTFFIDAVQLETSATGNIYHESALQLNGAITSPVGIQNTSDSTVALQVRNAAGTNRLFTVDTLNGKALFGDLTSNTVTVGTQVLIQAAAGKRALALESNGTDDILDLYTNTGGSAAGFDKNGNLFIYGGTIQAGNTTNNTQGQIKIADANNNLLTLAIPGNLGGAVTLNFPSVASGSNICTDGAICTGYQASATALVRSPATTAQNTIAPTAASVVALTVKGTTGTAANVLEVFDSTATPTRQAYFDNTGALTLSKTLTVSGAATSLTGATSGDAFTVSNSTSTGNIAVFKDNTSAVATIADGGAVLFHNSTDSATAFQIQNNSNASIFTADTAGSNISLLGNNDSKLSTWTTTSTLSSATARSGAVVANGFLYNIGGVTTGGTHLTTVQYSKINADGTVGTWSTTTSLPNARRQITPVVVNGYIYVIGGRDSTTIADTSYYAKINVDGTLGTWKTTTSLPDFRSAGGTVAYNGYIYFVGGVPSDGSTLQNTIYYSKVNPDGTLGSWSTAANSMPDHVANINGTIVANGYLYVPGGFSQNASGTSNDLLYAKLNADGTVGTWTTQSAALGGVGDDNFLTYLANGYLYVVGGDNAWSTPRVTSMALNANGSVGSVNALTNFPVNPVGEAAMAQANGYFYVIGGSSANNGGGTITNAVYYASASRVKVGGNLDLVGYSGENLAEDGASGQLTAGNTTVTGKLQVQDAANFVRSVSVGGILSVSDNASFGSNLTISGPTSNILASGSATATTGTTEATARTNVTTVTLTAAGSFANNDVIFLNNAGQDYYTRIVSGGGTTTLTVSPAVSYDVSTPVTKYNVQNIGATSTDYTTLSQRFFQGYFLGGVVTGTGSTTLSDGLLRSTNNLSIDAVGGTVSINGNLSLQGGTGILTVGTSSQAGSVVVNDGNGQKATIQVGDLAADRTLTIPVATGNDTFCLQTLANCAGGGGGANTALSNLAATAINANLTFAAADRTVAIAQAAAGAGNALTIAGGQGASGQTGGNLLLQAGANGTASGTPGSVIVKANGGNSTTAFQVQNASGVALIAADTTTQTLKVRAGSDTATESGTNIYSGNNFATQWTNTGWDTSITNKARHNTGNTNAITNTTVAITAGATYDLTFSLDGTCPVGDSVTITMGGVTVGTINGNGFCTGFYEYAVTTVNTNKLAFTPTSGWNGRFSSLAASTVTGATNSALTIQNSSGVANIEVRASANTSSTYIGLNSGSLNDTSLGVNNTALGANALKNNIFGNQNTAVGTNALQSNVGGIENTAVGVSALSNNQTGADNTAIGFQSLLNVTTGYSNTGLGYGALLNTATGHENIGIGVSAGGANLTGQQNTFIGDNAGNSDSDGFTSGVGLSNATAIGYGAQVQADYSLVLGGQGSNAVNVGIGTTVPVNTLSVMPVDFTYTAGTAWQSGTTISGSGTSWTSAVVGEQIVFSTGETATITGFTNSTTLTASTSQTVSASTGIPYRIHQPGLQVTNTGTVGIGTISPTARLEVVGDIISKGNEWTARTSAADNSWTSVAYGNGLFVAISDTGTGNRVMTSPDGINWTARTSAVDNDWQSVTYGNGLFVAVSDTGTGNRVMTSPNGINWTARTSAANNSWLGVTYGNGTFVAVSANGTNQVMTSSDGITWTSRAEANTDQWTSVTYGNGLFVAVANTGTGNRVMTSPDGSTWTSRTSSDDNQWTSVTYGNGLFVAVAITGSNSNRVMTSPDGITWTGHAVVLNSWSSVTYGGGQFVVVSQSGGGNRVMTSLDGSTWTIRSNPVNNTFTGVTYGNGTFVAVAQSGTGNRVMTSGRADYAPTSNNNTFQGGLTVNGDITLNGVIQSPTAQALTLQTTSSGNINLKPAGSSNIVIGTSDTTGTLLVLDTKTDVGDPTGVNGGMYYNSAYHEFRCYRDSNWEPCGINPIDRGFVAQDEFLGGCNNTLAYGDLGWTKHTIGADGSISCNPSIPLPNADHPGVLYISTPSVANQGSTIALSSSTGAGSMVLGKDIVVKQTVANWTTTNFVMRSGLHNETTTTTQPTSGVWWEANPSVSSNWRYCYGDSASATCASSGVAIASSIWMRLEIRITATGTGTSAATFIINGTSNSVSGVTIDTNNRVSPANSCFGTGGFSATCYYDYFQVRGVSSTNR